MDKEEKRSIIRSMPVHRRDMVFDFAVDTCYDWREERLFVWNDTKMYWFTEKQIKEVIKEAMAMGYKIAKEQEEAEQNN